MSAALWGAGLRLTGSLCDPPVWLPESYYTRALVLRVYGAYIDPASRADAEAARSPLYPVTLAAFMSVGRSPRTVSAVQAALLGLSLILLSAELATALYTPLAGVLAAWTLALLPIAVQHSSSIEIEGFFSVLVLLVAAAAVQWARRPDASSARALGLSLGVSLLCRSTLFAFLPALALGTLGAGQKAARRTLPALALWAALPLAPWVARNALLFHELVPFERHTAVVSMHAASRGAISGDPTSPQIPHDRLVAETVSNLRGTPSVYLHGFLRRWRAMTGWLLQDGPWAAAALAALALAARAGDPAARIVGLLIAYFLGISSLLVVEPRYFRPLLPLVVSLAGVGGAICLGPFTGAPGPRSGAAPGAGFRWTAAGLAAAVLLAYGYLARDLWVVPRLRLRPGREILGIALTEKGDYAGAVKAFRRELSTQPLIRERAVILGDLGTALALGGRCAEAILVCRQSLQLSPGNVAGTNCLEFCSHNSRK